MTLDTTPFDRPPTPRQLKIFPFSFGQIAVSLCTGNSFSLQFYSLFGNDRLIFFVVCFFLWVAFLFCSPQANFFLLSQRFLLSTSHAYVGGRRRVGLCPFPLINSHASPLHASLGRHWPKKNRSTS